MVSTKEKEVLWKLDLTSTSGEQLRGYKRISTRRTILISCGLVCKKQANRF